MNVAITGATGFIGRALVAALVARGEHVVALGRAPEAMHFAERIERRRFDPNDALAQPEAFRDIDAVIHLAGEPVSGRWTAAKKRQILESRVLGTQNVVKSLAACETRPAVLLSASGVGYYGARGDVPLFEGDLPGTDFLARVGVGWELAARDAEALGIRAAWLRTGIVLGDGGALKAMSPPFTFGFGGPFGGGRQFVPWIHLDDLVALYLFVLDSELRGAINAVTPDYATSARFAQALGAALRRPSLVPAPAFALRAVLGEFAQTLLASQVVIPARAEDAGFAWQHLLLEEAMASAEGGSASGSHGISVFESSQTVHASLNDVFAFFSDPQNLERLTPSTLRFAFRLLPDTVERGSRISYRLQLHGVPISWDTLIARWDPPHSFVDFQLHGPYALWRHEHRFTEVPGGVRLDDRVQYALPFTPFGNLAAAFVRKDVERIFTYRREAIAAHFAA